MRSSANECMTTCVERGFVDAAVQRYRFAYAFVWPPGVAPEADADKGRNPPAYYFQGMLHSMLRLGSVHSNSSFCVHMHPACSHLKQFLPKEVQVVECDEKDHWRYPVLQRSVTLLSDPGDDVVIMLDGHDDPQDQVEAIQNLLSALRQGKHAGFTFWPTDGILPEENKPSQGVTPRQFQVFAADSDRKKAWWIDCGLAITTKEFRKLLNIDYETFIRENLLIYNNIWKDFEALSDEAFLDMALFKGEHAALVKKNAVIQSHWLRAGGLTDTKLSTDVDPPNYIQLNERNELTGGRELVIPGQDKSMTQTRIKEVKLTWGDLPTVLMPLSKRKRAETLTENPPKLSSSGD